MHINVKTVSGLQAMLAHAMSTLQTLEKRDLHWVRATVSAVNSGNSLLRTDAAAQSTKAAKATKRAR